MFFKSATALSLVLLMTSRLLAYALRDLDKAQGKA